jgi:hypothetical protein
MPHTSTTVLRIDPTTDTTTTFGSLAVVADKWYGGVLATNGSIYGIPLSSTAVLKINTTAITTPIDFVCSRFFNKF